MLIDLGEGKREGGRETWISGLGARRGMWAACADLGSSGPGVTWTLDAGCGVRRGTETPDGAHLGEGLQWGVPAGGVWGREREPATWGRVVLERAPQASVIALPRHPREPGQPGRLLESHLCQRGLQTWGRLAPESCRRPDCWEAFPLVRHILVLLPPPTAPSPTRILPLPRALGLCSICPGCLLAVRPGGVHPTLGLTP